MKNTNQPYTSQFYPQDNKKENSIQTGSSQSQQQEAAPSGNKNTTGPDPLVQLPKGGGAIQGIGEKFQANPLTGTASITVPIAMTKGRASTGSASGSFSPQLALSYDSGSGNSPYGLGWNIGLPSITRKTDKGIPRYFDHINDPLEEDTFILSGAEDLVRKLDSNNQLLAPTAKTIGSDNYEVFLYLPRTEGLFAKIEKWVRQSDKDIHWRATTKDNTTNVYGQSVSARISDPEDGKRIFQWLIEKTTDNKGNIILYEYKTENSDNLSNEIYEKNRLNAPFANTYLKSVKYANDTMTGIDDDLGSMLWHMQMVLDYGEHHETNPMPGDSNLWNCRLDPFSSYKSGFEIRTWRLCKRILMFHKFTELGNDWTLVKSTHLAHNTDNWQNGDPIPALTLLESVTHSGYRGAETKSYPPLTFTYSEASSPDKIRSFDTTDLENLPVGVGADNSYQWIDLYNEGLSGVLVKNDETWYYKPNLGDKQFYDETQTETDFELGALVPLTEKPSMAKQATAFSLGDLDGNGQTDMSILSSSVQGFQELSDQGEWGNFTYFKDIPNIDWQDPNLKMIDLSGDGHADILITENQCHSCYFSRAKEGYNPAVKLAKEMDENLGPRLVFNDGSQMVFTADMSGDGLTDLVRINNGSIDYWPNMGYGKFGKKVSMKNAPHFDFPDAFDPGRIRLADIDGSGTTDILYVGQKTLSWKNLAGNQWSEAEEIQLMPPVDSASTLTVMDLMGKGTSCMVWSSALPGAYPGRMQYLELTGGKKPFLLQEMNNQMGGIRQFIYAPSSKFYLQDKKAGKEIISKLPFPVQVLEKTITIDEVTQTSYTNRYAYHHGYFDGQEREFRGFGMVEQWDTDGFQIMDEGDIHPVYTKTWFHTGFFKNHQAVSQLFAEEYFNGDSQAWLLPDTQLPSGLSAMEAREACRVLKGSVLRREVYALDHSDKEALPYTVEEKSYEIQTLQSTSVNKHGVFLVNEAETLSYHYERNANDPRIAHRLVLETDVFGNITKEAQVSYPRRNVPTELQEQGDLLIKYDKNLFINEADNVAFYRIGVPAESQSFQVYGLNFSNNSRFTKTELVNHINTASIIEYQEAYTSGAVIRTLVHSKQFYYSEDLSSMLSLGNVASHALPYHRRKLAYTSGLLQQIKDKNTDGSNYHNDLLQTANLQTLLVNDGSFTSDTTGLWVQSERQTYSASSFYLPVSSIDPFGNTTQMEYDNHHLLLDKVTDPLLDETLIQNDYYSLQPKEITDINLNHTEVTFDALGMVTATAIKGKEQSPGVWEGDTVSDPTVQMSYDLHNWKNNQKPVYVHTQARETHKDTQANWLQSYTYSDGLGRELQTKVQAEDGDAWEMGEADPVNSTNRWTSTGRTIYNNKGKVFKQYEPWFSTTHEYVNETHLDAFELAHITMHYDSVGRLIKTILPDENFTKVEFDAWQQKNFDQNDNDTGSTHKNTPQVQHLDALGRLFLTQDDNGTDGSPDYYDTRQKYNITGQVEKVKDAREAKLTADLWMTTNCYNMLGEAIYTENKDSGRRWLLTDVAQKPIYTWDNRHHQTEMEYDDLQRPLSESLRLSVSAVKKTQKTIYGTSSGNNSKGLVSEQYDQSGKTSLNTYDFKGNLLSLSKQMCTDYKNTIDWDNNPALDGVSFSQNFSYDAMNRPVQLEKPDSSIEEYTYNKAGLLESLRVKVTWPDTWTNVVTNINYNEKGQRTEIYYGNNTKTRYTYDANTFRLTQLLTTRNNGTEKLQDLNYVYDPVGNIIQVSDDAHTDYYFNNSIVEPVSTYTYDALYRLKTATGRELASLQMPTHTDFPNNIPVPNTASNAIQTYNQEFTYDELGNITEMKSVGNWTRDYYYDFANNHNYLLGHSSGTTTYTYDKHGNMLSMPHLTSMVWDHRDQLTEVTLNASNDKAYYVYDASGERVRKVIEKTGGIIEDRKYLGGFEIYKKTVSGSVDTERETLYVSDGQKKILSVDTLTDGLGNDLLISNFRYQYDNHLGSACLELDENASIITYEEYHPFGTTSYRSGRTETEVSRKRFKYVGKERDEETGLYYYGARYYAAWIARFVSVDPLQHKYPHYTPFQYAGNKPITYIDLDGLEEFFLPNGESRFGPFSEKYMTDNNLQNQRNNEYDSPVSPFISQKNDTTTNAYLSSGSNLDSFEYEFGSEYVPDFTLSFSTELRGGSKAKGKILGYGKEVSYGVSNTITHIEYGIDFKYGITVQEKTFFGKDAYRKPLEFYIETLNDPNTYENTNIGLQYGEGIYSTGAHIQLDDNLDVMLDGGLSPGIKGSFNTDSGNFETENILFDIGWTLKGTGFNIKMTTKDPIITTSEENGYEWVRKAQENVDRYGSITK